MAARESVIDLRDRLALRPKEAAEALRSPPRRRSEALA